MKIKLNAGELYKKLEHLLKVVPSKTAIQALNNVLIETRGDVVLVTASDSEMWLSVKCNLDDCVEGGRLCVGAMELASFMKNIGDRTVTMTSNSETNSITCEYDNGSFSMPYENADDFPLYNSGEEKTTDVIVDGSLVFNSIEMTRFAAANNEQLRPVLNGVHVDFYPDCIITTAASHQKIAIFKEKNVPFADGRNGGFTMTKKAAAVLSSMLGSVDGEVKISFNSKSMSVNNSSFKLYSVLIEYPYPDCRKLIPTDRKCLVTIDKDSLLLALKRITPATNDMSNLVMFDFSEGQVKLSADNAQYGKSASETVPCDCDGEATIGFKGSNVIETLRNIDDDDIVIELTDESHAGVFYSAFKYTRDEYVTLCMPMLTAPK